MLTKKKYFTVTEDHLKLFRRLCFRYEDDVEFGAPAVDPKRPYGTGDVYVDIAEILDITPAEKDRWDDGYFSGEQRDSMLRLHKELVVVLEIAVRNNGVEVGDYEASQYGCDWKPVVTRL